MIAFEKKGGRERTTVESGILTKTRDLAHGKFTIEQALTLIGQLTGYPEFPRFLRYRKQSGIVRYVGAHRILSDHFQRKIVSWFAKFLSAVTAQTTVRCGCLN
jgi:hypothetical protein